jgi:hypothetical protein
MHVSAKKTAIVSYLNNSVWGIVALTGAVLMATLTLHITPPSLITPDSASYLEWSTARTPGYPLFLTIVGLFNANFICLPHIQMSLLIGSSAFLAQAAARLGGYWWIWAMMGAAIFGNPFLWQYVWQIQSEILFISLLNVFLACVAMALPSRPEGIAWLIASGVVLGAAILVRPVGYALLGVALATGILWRGRRFPALAALTLPASVMVLAVSGWNFISKGYFGTQIFGGYNIIGQVALLVTPDVETNDPILHDAIQHMADDLTALRLRLPTELGSWKKYFLMTAYSYNTILTKYALPAISDADRSAGTVVSSPIEAAKRINAQAWSIALTTIRRHPDRYIYHIFINFLGLWTLPTNITLLHEDLCNPLFRASFCETGEIHRVPIKIRGGLEVLKDSTFFGLMGLSLVLIVTVAWRPRSSLLLVFAAVAALCINANHLLVSIFEAGIPRYALAMWPALLVMFAASAAWVTILLSDHTARRGLKKAQSSNPRRGT